MESLPLSAKTVVILQPFADFAGSLFCGDRCHFVRVQIGNNTNRYVFLVEMVMRTSSGRKWTKTVGDLPTISRRVSHVNL